MDYKKQAALVAQLKKATAEGKVAWEGSAREGAFEAAFPRQSVVIMREIFPPDDELYSIAVINKDGEVADEFSSTDLRSEPGAPNYSWFASMKEIWQLARRRAQGAEEALDDILGELGGANE